MTILMNLHHRCARVRLPPFGCHRGTFVWRSLFGYNSTNHFSSSIPSEQATKTSNKSNKAIYSPVVIVGGGPTGLFLSHLLHTYKVPFLLVERETPEERFRHPQAHFLNTRTMELLQFWLPRQVSSDIMKAMPPVEHWQSFQFVHNMSMMSSSLHNGSASNDEPLAHVVHPVHRPLQALRDANGVLKSDYEANRSHYDENLTHSLSPCTVGHLAQHTFGRILYDHLQTRLESQQQGQQLCYGTSVQRLDVIQNSDKTTNDEIVLQTESGKRIQTNMLLAADGAHSFVRNALQIPFVGQEGLQHLINLHVTIDDKEAIERLHSNKNHAMLYSIFNEHVVAMVVCHSLGEYIIQIPYFPPYQTMEEDFSPERLKVLIPAIFGSAVEPHKLRIHSCQPWTMSAKLADRYYYHSRQGDGATSAAVALVGDAAHVFPPAGGFGMNTGLQDAHNLAWKVAAQFHNNHLRRPSQNDKEDNSETNIRFSTTKSLLESYDQERRPIAQQNAALSVRNYKRLLEVTKACYLNEQHPTLLKKALDVSGAIVPLSTRQLMFRSSLQAALFPLSYLNATFGSSNPYKSHIQNNLQKILKSGAGLPLLFPRFELGFTYNKSGFDQQSGKLQDDTWGSIPLLEAGRLFPHVVVETINNNPSTKSRGNLTKTFRDLHFMGQPGFGEDDQSVEQSARITTANLPAQLARDGLPTFVLFVFGLQPLPVRSKQVESLINDARDEIRAHTGLPLEVVCLLSGELDDAGNFHDSASSQTSGESSGSLTDTAEILFVRECSGHSAFSFASGALPPQAEATKTDGGFTSVLIRPDGHIASVVAIEIEKSTGLVSKSALNEFVDTSLSF